VNLNSRFGDRYRIAYGPAHTGRAVEPWLQIIPCRHGHIYVHGRDTLGFASNNRGPIANRVASLPFVTLTQDADDGLNMVFHVRHFDAVAEIVLPRTRRKPMSPENKAKAVERLAKFAFSPAQKSPENERQGVQTPLVVQEALQPTSGPTP
jgi:hypothetical protein